MTTRAMVLVILAAVVITTLLLAVVRRQDTTGRSQVLCYDEMRGTWAPCRFPLDQLQRDK